MKLSDLTEALGGKLAAGSPEREVEGVNSVDRACASELVFAEDAASAAQAFASRAGVVVLAAGDATACPEDKCAVEAHSRGCGLPAPPGCSILRRRPPEFIPRRGRRAG